MLLVCGRYFSQRAEKKKEEEGDESDAGSVSDTEFDDFLGQSDFPVFRCITFSVTQRDSY